ncbi:MAG: zf-HC2 domain-containing protein, partial [Acidobacteriota bacterium]
WSCQQARGLAHRRLDGELEPDGWAALDDHLARCGECRAWLGELESIQSGLRELAEVPMPEELLARLERLPEAVTGRRRRILRGRLASARPFAAAAALALLLLAPLALIRSLPSHERRAAVSAPSLEDPQVARTAAEVRYVFSLAQQALAKSGEVTVNEVLRGTVAPALHRIPPFGPIRDIVRPGQRAETKL